MKKALLALLLVVSHSAYASQIPVRIEVRMANPGDRVVSARGHVLSRGTLPIVGLCGRIQWVFPLPVPQFIYKAQVEEIEVPSGETYGDGFSLVGSASAGLCGYEPSVVGFEMMVEGDPTPYKMSVALVKAMSDVSPVEQSATCITNVRSPFGHECFTRPRVGLNSNNLHYAKGEPVEYSFTLDFADNTEH